MQPLALRRLCQRNGTLARSSAAPRAAPRRPPRRRQVGDTRSPRDVTGLSAADYTFTPVGRRRSTSSRSPQSLTGRPPRDHLWHRAIRDAARRDGQRRNGSRRWTVTSTPTRRPSGHPPWTCGSDPEPVSHLHTDTARDRLHNRDRQRPPSRSTKRTPDDGSAHCRPPSPTEPHSSSTSAQRHRRRIRHLLLHASVVLDRSGTLTGQNRSHHHPRQHDQLPTANRPAAPTHAVTRAPLTISGLEAASDHHPPTQPWSRRPHPDGDAGLAVTCAFSPGHLRRPVRPLGHELVTVGTCNDAASGAADANYQIAAPELPISSCLRTHCPS